MLLLHFLLVNFLFTIITGQRPSTNNLPSVVLPENDLKDHVTEIFNNCKCVIFYLCDEDNFIIPREQLKNTRVPSNYLLRNVKRLRCTNEFYYCCQNRTSTSAAFTIETALPETKQISYTPKPNGLKCGQSESHNSSRIIDQFPWVVAIYQKKKSNFILNCGGSLINPKIVLTIQQCVHFLTPDEVKVSVNQEMINKKLSSSQPSKQASKIIKHENYNPGTRFNDVALIILEDPVKSVAPICLSNLLNHNFNEQHCVYVGWKKKGRFAFGLKTFEDLPINGFRSCKRFLKNTHSANNSSLHSSFLCSNVGTHSISKVKKGGPLMCKEGDHYTLTGILSRTIVNRGRNVPKLYTNIGFFNNWVKQMIAANLAE